MPEKRLSDLALRNAKLPAGRREKMLGDGGNLFLRLRPESRDWMYVWKVGGTKRKLMLGPLADLSLAEAREKARVTRGQVADGKHPRLEREKQRSEQFALEREQASKVRDVEQLFETWFAAEVEPNYKDSGNEIRRRFTKDTLPALGTLRLEAVKRSDVVRLIDSVAQRGASRVAGHLLADLRQMFQFAVLRETMPSNPTNGLRKQDWNGQATERDRVLSEDEIRLLRDQLPAAKLIVETECAIWIMLSTACRVGELSRARWEYIVDKQLRLPKEATKTDRAHDVDLSPFALKQFKRLKAANPKSEWCFPAKHHTGPVYDKAITKQITDRQRPKQLKGRSPATETLKLPGGRWTSHDLRRTASTLMGKLGVLPHVIEAVLNHAEPNRMKRIYQRHEYQVEMRDAWRRLGAHLTKILRKKATAAQLRQ